MGAMDKRVILKDAQDAHNMDTTNKVADCCVRVMSRTDYAADNTPAYTEIVG